MNSLDELIRRMAKCRETTTTEIRRKIDVILTLCEPYRNMGYSFTFDFSGDLANDVNRILVLLSDTLLNDFKRLAADNGSPDDDDAVKYAVGERNGMPAQERLDRHCARLRHILEGWIAISFVNGMDKQKTLSKIMHYLENPFSNPEWSDALMDKKYKASILADGDRNRKPGLQHSIISSVDLVGEGIVNDAHCYREIQAMEESGAMRYGVRRMSDFPCKACDDVCSKTYPITEIVVPVHPRCVCQTFPVYSED